jgi:hypothetical protein
MRLGVAIRGSGNSPAVTTYRIRREPRFLRDDADEPLPGHYEGEFARGDGPPLRRYLTDRGRAEVLRLLEKGEHDLSQEDFDDLTVEPSMEALIARMAREGAVGG